MRLSVVVVALGTFPKENKVFQRPGRSVLLQSWCFATTVVNYYDRSIFSMAGSLGQSFKKSTPVGTRSRELYDPRFAAGLPFPVPEVPE